MEVILDNRNENYFIITLKGGNQIKVNKNVNTLENTIKWLKSMGATKITVFNERGKEEYE